MIDSMLFGAINEPFSVQFALNEKRPKSSASSEIFHDLSTIQEY